MPVIGRAIRPLAQIAKEAIESPQAYDELVRRLEPEMLGIRRKLAGELYPDIPKVHPAGYFEDLLPEDRLNESLDDPLDLWRLMEGKATLKEADGLANLQDTLRQHYVTSLPENIVSDVQSLGQWVDELPQSSTYLEDAMQRLLRTENPRTLKELKTKLPKAQHAIDSILKQTQAQNPQQLLKSIPQSRFKLSVADVEDIAPKYSTFTSTERRPYSKVYRLHLPSSETTPELKPNPEHLEYIDPEDPSFGVTAFAWARATKSSDGKALMIEEIQTDVSYPEDLKQIKGWSEDLLASILMDARSQGVEKVILPTGNALRGLNETAPDSAARTLDKLARKFDFTLNQEAREFLDKFPSIRQTHTDAKTDELASNFYSSRVPQIVLTFGTGATVGSILNSEEASAFPLKPIVKAGSREAAEIVTSTTESSVKMLEGFQLPRGVISKVTKATTSTPETKALEPWNDMRYLHMQDGSILPMSMDYLNALIGAAGTRLYKNKFLTKDAAGQIAQAMKSLTTRMAKSNQGMSFDEILEAEKSSKAMIEEIDPSLIEQYSTVRVPPGSPDAWNLRMPDFYADLLSQLGEVTKLDRAKPRATKSTEWFDPTAPRTPKELKPRAKKVEKAKAKPEPKPEVIKRDPAAEAQALEAPRTLKDIMNDLKRRKTK